MFRSIYGRDCALRVCRVLCLGQYNYGSRERSGGGWAHDNVHYYK